MLGFFCITYEAYFRMICSSSSAQHQGQRALHSHPGATAVPMATGTGTGRAGLEDKQNLHPLGSCCQGKLWHEFSLSAAAAGHVLRSPGSGDSSEPWGGWSSVQSPGPAQNSAGCCEIKAGIARAHTSLLRLEATHSWGFTHPDKTSKSNPHL